MSLNVFTFVECQSTYSNVWNTSFIKFNLNIPCMPEGSDKDGDLIQGDTFFAVLYYFIDNKLSLQLLVIKFPHNRQGVIQDL